MVARATKLANVYVLTSSPLPLPSYLARWVGRAGSRVGGWDAGSCELAIGGPCCALGGDAARVDMRNGRWHG